MAGKKLALRFQEELETIFQEAHEKGLSHVEVLSKELHDRVISPPYTPKEARMPSCCGVMKKTLRVGDHILSDPQKLQTSTLRIRYKIPR